MKKSLLLLTAFLLPALANAGMQAPQEPEVRSKIAKQVKQTPNLSWYQNPNLLSLKARFMPGKHKYYSSLQK